MLIHFENYISNVTQLETVKNDIEMFTATVGVVPTDRQIALYESRAAQVDNKAIRDSKTRRLLQAFQTELYFSRSAHETVVDYDASNDVPDG